MNVYIETNFILELVFQQEQFTSCENILKLCEAGAIRIVVPAYSLAEPHEKLTRQANSRKNLQRLLDNELRQLVRSAPYAMRIRRIKDIATLLIQSNEEEKQRFERCRDRLTKTAHTISLTVDIVRSAAVYEKQPFDLKPQDAMVYASVIAHLDQHSPTQSCFLNRNTKDFAAPDIEAQLNSYNCKLIPQFDDGIEYIKARLG